MRKQTEWNDSNGNAEGEATPESTRRQKPRSEGSLRPASSSGITTPTKAKEEISRNHWESLSGTSAIDWFETAMCIQWDDVIAETWFKKLLECKEIAQDKSKKPTIKIGQHVVTVANTGSGRGRDAHKEIKLSWKGVTLALSQRGSTERKHSNGTVLISGEPCLLVGWRTAREVCVEIIRHIGGTIIDEWVRRLDICVDLPNLDFPNVVYPLLREHCFVTTCRSRSYHEQALQATGFAVGQSSRLRVQIYDKIVDCIVNHDSVYQAAMEQHRWNGSPPFATRVEWQFGREWLQQYGLRDVNAVLNSMPAVLTMIADCDRGAFRIVDGVPDRGEGHQSRQAAHPLWKRIVQIAVDEFGMSDGRMKRIERSKLSEERTVSQVIGLLTSLADRRQRICSGKHDLIQVLADKLVEDGITDETIYESWEKKAKVSGTWEDLMSFDANNMEVA